MKKFMALALASCLFVAGCADNKVIGHHEYSYCGLLNADTCMNPNIQYEMSVGSIVVAIIFFETIIAPVYVIGYDLYQPVSYKSSSPENNGIIR